MSEPSHILSHFNYVPNFCAQPTKVSVRSGNWSDPATWGGSVVDTGLIQRLQAILPLATNETAAGLIANAIAILAAGTGGSIPTADDVVQVAAGHTVTTNAVIDAKAIGVHGVLQFAGPTTLTADTIIVYSDGKLAGEQVDARIIFRDTAPGSDDPDQFGTGLLAFGALHIDGRDKTEAARVIADIWTGDSTLILDRVPSGWKVGDVLHIPDTRMMPVLNDYRSKSPHDRGEKVEIANIAGNVVNLTSPVRFDHPAARNATDNAIRFTAPVLNLTRNVRFESANPNGTRGHMIAFDRADIRIRNAEFRDMGRTTYTPKPGDRYDEHKLSLDSTVMAADVQTTGFGGLPGVITVWRSGDGVTFSGQATWSGVSAALSHGKIVFTKGANSYTTPVIDASAWRLVKRGTNQIARYPIHLHHLTGPKNLENTGYQFEISGCVVHGSVPTKWGIACHHASYGLLRNNIILNTQHWAVVTEDGSEYQNEFVGNYAASNSTAAAFYFSGPLNRINDNVAFNSFSGFVINSGHPNKLVTVPLVRGAHSAAEERTLKMMDANLLSFDGNEAFGCSLAFQFYDFALLTEYGGGQITGEKVIHVDNFRCWHNLRTTTFYNGDDPGPYMAPHWITNLVARGDISQAKGTDSDGDHVSLQWGGGCEFVLDGCDIQGFLCGVRDRARQGNSVAGVMFRAEMRGCNFANKTDFAVDGNWTADPDGKRTVLTSPMFLPIVSRGGLRLNKQSITTNAVLAEGIPLAPVQIYVRNINGTGRNLRVYMLSQDPTFKLPAMSRIPAELVGKTNTEAWWLAGKAIGGAVAPASAVSNFPGVVGLVEELPAWPEGLEV